MATKLKVLPLESWMKYIGGSLSWKHRERTLRCYKRANPIISNGRPGLYLQGNVCWFELGDGRCYWYSKLEFIRRLNLLNSEDLRPEEIKGLSEICKCRLATKKQLSLFGAWDDARSRRSTRRLGRMAVLRMMKILKI